MATYAPEQREGELRNHAMTHGQAFTANLYDMSIAQLRRLPTKVLDLHLQQRHATRGSVMEKAARLYKNLQSVCDILVNYRNGSQEASRHHVTAASYKITKTVKQSMETMRDDIVGSLLGNVSGTKSLVVQKLAGIATPPEVSLDGPAPLTSLVQTQTHHP